MVSFSKIPDERRLAAERQPGGRAPITGTGLAGRAESGAGVAWAMLPGAMRSGQQLKVRTRPQCADEPARELGSPGSSTLAHRPLHTAMTGHQGSYSGCADAIPDQSQSAGTRRICLQGAYTGLSSLKQKRPARRQAVDLFGCGGAQLVLATATFQALTTCFTVRLGNRRVPRSRTPP